MNLHTLPRTFYLTRHGQSEYNLLGKIGGDSGVTPAGKEYAHRLALFAKEYIGHTTKEDPETGKEVKQPRPARLWTSTLRRTKETAQFIEHNTFEHTYDNGDKIAWMQFRPMARRNLDELYAGTCDGMTYKEIEKVYPDEFERRQADKLAYRYPRGMASTFLFCLFWITKCLCELFLLNMQRFLFFPCSGSLFRGIVHGCDPEVRTIGSRNGAYPRTCFDSSPSGNSSDSVCLFYGSGSKGSAIRLNPT